MRAKIINSMKEVIFIESSFIRLDAFDVHVIVSSSNINTTEKDAFGIYFQIFSHLDVITAHLVDLEVLSIKIVHQIKPENAAR